MRSSSSTSFSGRHAGPPFVARLELDGRLDHLERRRIGRRVGAARLPEHALDLRHRADQAIGLLQQLRGLPAERPGRADGMCSRSPSSSGGMNSPPRRGTGHDREASSTSADARSSRSVARSTRSQQRPVPRDEHAIDGIASLAWDAAADEVAHQHRHQRHREPCCGGHRVRLRVRERREQADPPAPRA